MRALIIIWIVGFALVLCIFALPPLRVALLIASVVYFITVLVVCFLYAKELNANVQLVEQQLSTVRYGTVTEKNAPLI